MGQGSIIGYEINERTCQISFYNDEELEPDTPTLASATRS